jgi:hypothetical protein
MPRPSAPPRLALSFLARLRRAVAATAATALLAVLAVPGFAVAQADDPPTAQVPVDRWLVAGPVAAALPAFSGETGLGVPDELGPADLLPAAPGDDERVWPREGAEHTWASGAAMTWTARAAQGGAVSLDAGDGSRPRLAWLVAYVETGRFVEAKLTVRSAHPVRVFVDGRAVGTGKGSGASEDGDGEEGDDTDENGQAASGTLDEVDDAVVELADDPTGQAVERRDDGESAGEGATADDEEAEGDDDQGSPTEAEVTLPTGKHRILVATVFDPAAGAPWTVSASLAVPEDARHRLALSTSPERGLVIEDLLDVPGVQGAVVSADGALVAVTLARPQVPSDDRSQWVEIVRAADAAPVRSIRLPGSVTGFSWAPRGRAYAYRTAGKEGRSTLWVGDLESGALEPLLRDVEKLSSHVWAADARSLFVVIGEA